MMAPVRALQPVSNIPPTGLYLPDLPQQRQAGLAARNTKARSRQKSIHAAFFSSVRSSMAPFMGGPCGRGASPCRSLGSGLLTRMCPPTPFSSEAADSYHNQGVSHDW